MFINLQPVIQDLSNITDDNLRDEIRKMGLRISDNKFEIAFSCYGLTKLLSGLEKKHLRGGVSIPDEKLESLRWKGVFVLRAYIVFVYMRSDILENRLDNVEDYSPLRPFRDFFRKAKQAKKGLKVDRSLGQRFRNALSHGTFNISDDLKIVRFQDKNGWVAEVFCKDFFDGLCYQIFRFYFLAFKVSRESRTIN